jgi:hypothetical protein
MFSIQLDFRALRTFTPTHTHNWNTADATAVADSHGGCNSDA